MVKYLVEQDSSNQRVLAITGMAGCGKTQLVSYFLQEHGSRYPHILFVDTSSSISLKNDFQAWARSLGNGHEHDVWEDARRLLASTLEENWILVFDNFDDPKLDLEPFIPRSKYGTIIITSRNRDASNFAGIYHLELGEMEKTEALAVLLRAARRQARLLREEMESANELLERLGFLAVALVQAGSLCYQRSSLNEPFTFTDYLSLFDSERATFMQLVLPTLDNYQLGTYAALNLSYRTIPVLCQKFLHFLAFFHHSYISLEMFANAAKFKFADPIYLMRRQSNEKPMFADLYSILYLDGEWSEVHIHEIARNLRAFSLISISSTAGIVFLHLHPLVKSWAKDILKEHELYGPMAGQVVSSSRGTNQSSRYLLSHAQEILKNNDSYDLHINVVTMIATIFNEMAFYDKAEKILKSSLKSMESLYPSYIDEEPIMHLAILLAKAYNTHTKWEKAERVVLNAFDRYFKRLGNDNYDIIKLMGILGSTYDGQNRLVDAERIKYGVFMQHKKLKGLEDNDTLIAAANLAVTYGLSGEFKLAHLWHSQVLELRKRLNGEDHPFTIYVMANLAVANDDLGYYEEGERMSLKVVEWRRRVLGDKHPETIAALSNLASNYFRREE